jgi:hypothetical protein
MRRTNRNLENGEHISILLEDRKNQENLCQNWWLQDLPHIYRIIASSSANKKIRNRLRYTSQACCCCAERLNFMPEYHHIRDYSNYNPEGTFYSNIYSTRCNVTQFILSENCSTCFGWYYHPSSKVQTTVTTASDISQTVTATCR